MLRPAIPKPWFLKKNLREIAETLVQQTGKPFSQLSYAEWYKLAFNEPAAIAIILPPSYDYQPPKLLERIYVQHRKRVKTAKREGLHHAIETTKAKAEELISELGPTVSLQEAIRLINDEAQEQLHGVFRKQQETYLQPILEEITQDFLQEILEYTLDHQESVGNQLTKFLEALQQRHLAAQRPLTKVLAAKLLRGAKHATSFKTDAVLTALGDDLSPKEQGIAKPFLEWLRTTKQAFGTANIFELYKQYQQDT